MDANEQPEEDAPHERESAVEDGVDEGGEEAVPATEFGKDDESIAAGVDREEGGAVCDALSEAVALFCGDALSVARAALFCGDALKERMAEGVCGATGCRKKVRRTRPIIFCIADRLKTQKSAAGVRTTPLYQDK